MTASEWELAGAKNGGSLSWIGKGRTVPEFEKAAFSLPKGGTSDVVKVPTNNAAQVTPALYAEWAPRLRQRIERFQPAVAAFIVRCCQRPRIQTALDLLLRHMQGQRAACRVQFHFITGLHGGQRPARS